PLLVAGGIVVLAVKPEGPFYLSALVLALLCRRTAVFVAALLAAIAVVVFTSGSNGGSSLPEVVLAEAPPGLSARKFGFAFVLLAALAVSPRRLVGACPAPALGRLILFGLLVILGPFTLPDDRGLEHQVRSSMDRRLMHWAIPAALLGAAWI